MICSEDTGDEDEMKRLLRQKGIDPDAYDEVILIFIYTIYKFIVKIYMAKLSTLKFFTGWKDISLACQLLW